MTQTRTTHPGLDPRGAWREDAGSPRLVVLSGAGLSVESGLSLFRDTHGLWARYDVQRVCNFLTWRQHALEVHGFFNAYRLLVDEAIPHAGHAALARLEAEGAVLVTQNVDNLLERAGAQHVIHLHGRAEDLQCLACGTIWSVGTKGQWDALNDWCPGCPSRQQVKPGVVFFNEMAPAYELLDQVIEGLRAQDVLLILGTSGEVVNPLLRYAHLPEQLWLANLEPRPDLPDGAFKRVWHAPITQSIGEIVEAWYTYRDGFR